MLFFLEMREFQILILLYYNNAFEITALKYLRKLKESLHLSAPQS